MFDRRMVLRVAAAAGTLGLIASAIGRAQTGQATRTAERRPDPHNPPDFPRCDGADVLPKTFVPPYHYRNPVTGRPWVAPPPRTSASQQPGN